MSLIVSYNSVSEVKAMQTTWILFTTRSSLRHVTSIWAERASRPDHSLFTDDRCSPTETLPS
jgi:hypothetical protein